MSRATMLKAGLSLSSRDTVVFDDVLGVVVLGVAKEEVASFDTLKEADRNELFAKLSATCAAAAERDVDDSVGQKPVRRLVVSEVRERGHPVPAAVVAGSDESRV